MFIEFRKVKNKANEITESEPVDYKVINGKLEPQFEKHELPALKVLACKSQRVDGKVRKTSVTLGTIHQFTLSMLYEYNERSNEYEISCKDLMFCYRRLFKESTKDKLKEHFTDEEIEDLRFSLTDKLEDYIVKEILTLPLFKKVYEAREKKKRIDELVENFKSENENYFVIYYTMYGMYAFDKVIEKYLEYFDIDGNCIDERGYKYFKESNQRHKESSQQSNSKVSGNMVTTDNKSTLKKFYRELAKKFHPDCGGTEEEIKVLNNLKEQWGV